MEKFFNWFASTLWGAPTITVLFLLGLYLTIRTKFFVLRNLGYALKNTLGNAFKKDNLKGEGVMTPFQAVATALASCVGNGNIAGVASAIAIGGPGAVFWMWVVAFLGMTTKMAEISLGVKYREKDSNGNFYGGPMYYIERGLGSKWKLLAKFYAVVMVIGALGTAVFVQPQTMSVAMKNIFNIPPVITVTTSVVITAIVIFGGFKRIGEFCEKLTPLMATIYVVAAIGIIVANISKLPAAFGMIFKYAFHPAPAIGGFVGSTVKLAMQKGFARGTFSNEAGMGSASMVHSTAITDHPIRQGLYGIFEVFVDTIVICSMTALVILTSSENLWCSGLTGADLTIAAFSKLYGSFGAYIVGIGVLLFAFSTMIGYTIHFETAVKYLFGSNAIKLFRVIYLIPPFLTLGKTTEFAWTVVDVVTGLWIIPNVIALIFLSNNFVNLCNDFEDKVMGVEKKLKE
ncbi:MAG: alanine/glycine:cation symporter family protein [Thermovenabulum sp.]|uniref:alanine/glycine:cation symporter family protein n=1 Tax=Thermovenabulum sp. TaxID=3100335 RepID=UPI003C7D8B91